MSCPFLLQHYCAHANISLSCHSHARIASCFFTLHKFKRRCSLAEVELDAAVADSQEAALLEHEARLDSDAAVQIVNNLGTAVSLAGTSPRHALLEFGFTAAETLTAQNAAVCAMPKELLVLI